MDSKTKGKIINAVRKVTYTYSPRNKVRNRQKVAPASFRCELCEYVIYTGTKDLDVSGLDEFENKKIGKVYIDHIDPCIPIEGFGKKGWDWNIYLNRLFCKEEGLQLLCKECHDQKTKEENNQRKKFRNQKGKKYEKVTN